MKKSILLLALTVFTLQGYINASTVSQQTAQTIAANFYKVSVPAAANTTLSPTLAYTQSETNGTVDFYVFNVSPFTGFVIVSACDATTPILGYSSESNFTPTIPAYAAINGWLKSASKRVNYAVSNNLQATPVVQGLWSTYAAGQNPNASRSTIIGPLMTTVWNQNPYYNSLCPPASETNTNAADKSVTGCVATTMAQIMKYWNYPRQGTGTHSYSDERSAGYSENYGTLTTDMTRVLNWSAMPNNVTTTNSPVDSLMYELGIAVDMDYSPTGSGSIVLAAQANGGPSAQSVYLQNFYYDPSTLQGVYLSSYTDAAWVAVMENEINSGRVVQYIGDDSTQGGHTWVMDGYQVSATAHGGALLHMNWGWGGYDDGYFDVTNLLTTNDGFDPIENDAALIGIQPIAPFSLITSAASAAICTGTGGTTLNAQGPASATYTWTPATGLSCTTCASPAADPSATTLYTVVADSAGATFRSSVLLTVANPITASFNYTTANTCGLPENVSFSNLSTNAASYTWDFGDGSTSTSASPAHAYSTVGSYTATLYATNACGIASVVSNTPIQITGGAPIVPSQSICDGNTATLTATGSNVNWYADAAGATLIQSGNSYQTPSLSSTITYYVQSSVQASNASVGPTSDAIGTATVLQSGPGTIRGMYFNSTLAQTLVSVVVYATGAGGRQFWLQDGSGNVLDSITLDLANGQQTVTLNFPIPVGDSLLLAINGTANLTRNSTGAVFPYVSSDGTISITNNNAGVAGRYYFFYDWQLQQAACTSALAPVTIYVLNSGGGNFTASGTGTTANFTPADLSASSYSWDFGDGNSSTLTSPSHSYATAGTYTVQLIISNGTCADTITKSVTTSALGITDLSTLSDMTVSPNPARDVITLNLNSTKQLNDCSVKISNVLGQMEYSNDVNINTGSNSLNINVSNLATGIYFISLQNGKDVVTSKFVKTNQ